MFTKVDEKFPPACGSVLVRRIDRKTNRPVFEVYYVSTHPRECVEGDQITHWMKIPSLDVGDI